MNQPPEPPSASEPLQPTANPSDAPATGPDSPQTTSRRLGSSSGVPSVSVEDSTLISPQIHRKFWENVELGRLTQARRRFRLLGTLSSLRLAWYVAATGKVPFTRLGLIMGDKFPRNARDLLLKLARSGLIELDRGGMWDMAVITPLPQLYAMLDAGGYDPRGASETPSAD
jgi:hypothetical protein